MSVARSICECKSSVARVAGSKCLTAACSQVTAAYLSGVVYVCDI